jgi:thiamine biosynthesis lipoprotein
MAMLRIRIIQVSFLLAVCTILLDASVMASEQSGCVAEQQPGGGQWWRETRAIMGTEIQVEVWHEQQAAGCAAIHAVLAEMNRIDSAMSPYIESSLLSNLNRNAASGPVQVDAELFDLIAASLSFSEITDGAFDITYASVGRYYDYRSGLLPDDETMAKSIQAINYRYIEMDAESHSISYKIEGVYIDLGGIAKGYAVDRGIEILQAHGITQGLVGAGGDSRMLGDRGGEPWVVGIRDPRRASEMVAVLPLMDVSVSTSGDYERFFEKDGVRYHHIIDPGTGDSAREVRSVTILGDQATQTDALSTSVFVLGVERGLALINGMDNFDAIIVDGKGHLHLSNSLLQLTTSR